jgi:hypothetical protein
METNLNDQTARRLTEREWWASACPERLIAAIGCRPGSTIGEAVEVALEKLELRPEDVTFETLREIFLEVEPFLEPARKDWLRSIGLLRRAPRGSEFRAWTEQQHNAERRADDELMSKLNAMNRVDQPQREHAARVIASLAVRGRITSEERALLVGRGLLDEDFEARGPVQ